MDQRAAIASVTAPTLVIAGTEVRHAASPITARSPRCDPRVPPAEVRAPRTHNVSQPAEVTAPLPGHLTRVSRPRGISTACSDSSTVAAASPSG
jgi:hypothetical protein